MGKLFAAIVLSVSAAWNCSAAPPALPDPIAAFCKLHFAPSASKSDEVGGLPDLSGLSGIAMPGERFNRYDFIMEDLPMRRIIDYAVDGETSWLRYEHGGFAPHVHLVAFRTDDPARVVASYFLGERHGSLASLRANKALLAKSVATSDEL